MDSRERAWPPELAQNTVSFSVDVEWAAEPVIDDVRSLFDRQGVTATFFVTHPGVSVPGHERGLHPNFRRNGDSYRKLENASLLSDDELGRQVIATTLSYAPEAKGVRAHCLHADSTLMPLYRERGMEYDSGVLMPMVAGIRPYWTYGGLVELPIYYGDFLDISARITDLRPASLGLDRPGMKVLNFHPNTVFINAASEADYSASKSFYHDVERLAHARYRGRGVRTLLIELLEYVQAKRIPTATLGEISAAWRTTRPWS